MKKYNLTWQDHIRHIANFCFVASYICLVNGLMISGSLFTIVGEFLLAPSALKQRSWSTLIVCSIFLAIATHTLARNSFLSGY